LRVLYMPPKLTIELDNRHLSLWECDKTLTNYEVLWYTCFTKPPVKFGLYPLIVPILEKFLLLLITHVDHSIYPQTLPSGLVRQPPGLRHQWAKSAQCSRIARRFAAPTPETPP